MTNLIHLAHLLTAAWAAAGDLITAGLILGALNVLANSIRLTYKAGCFCGRLAWPAIHWLAAVVRMIDWRFVAAVVIDGLKILAVAVVAAVVTGHAALIGASERLGKLYAASIASMPDAPKAAAAAAVAPIVHPLAMIASDLESLTAKQLREITGSRRKVAKAQLVAAWLAA